MYCEFTETGEVFKNKKIYKCTNCGLTVALENPKAQILCFPYARAVFAQDTYSGVPEQLRGPQLVNSTNDIEKIMEKSISSQHQNHQSDTNDTLCSQEIIEKRLSICKQCEYYKDNACMLCGCHIVREKNYQNKLANKNAHCPDGRWGPVN